MAFANASPTTVMDGRPYSTEKVMPAAEGQLYNQSGGSNTIGVGAGEAALVTIVFTACGNPLTNTTYAVLQTRLRDTDVWVDVAWCVWTGTAGQAIFILSGGVAGANAVQNTRASGTAPGSNGSNQIPLGGQIRIVGKSTLGSQNPSSSPFQAAPQQVTATIAVKLLGLR